MSSSIADTRKKNDDSKRAAIYVRMSTEKQNYSLQHQRVVIDDYALRHGLSIERTYADSGKSGLRIEGRAGLQSLLDIVSSGDADFSTILVYDVSRWGRFQDADESAYYEFICRRAGINVVYCAELFADDESPMAAILKSLKRLMASEYSRELSAKVFAAQSNFILMGFKQGGLAGYGLRRLSLDQAGQPRFMLRSGERKFSQTDRVVLVPGPEDETLVVHAIYDWYTRLKLGDKRISDMLNAAGILSELGRPWTKTMVRSVLTNEKYAGHAVYNRNSYKLRKRPVKNPPNMWIRKDDAYVSLISGQCFKEAQAERAERHKRYKDEELLGMLREIHTKHGRISALLINQRAPAPTAQTFKYHFGTLANAYALAGVATPEHFSYVESRRILRAIRVDLVDQVTRLAIRAGGTAVLTERKDRLLVNGHLIVQVMAVRCQQEGRTHLRRWRLRLSLTEGAHFTIAAQMHHLNREVQSYYLFPAIDHQGKWLPLPARFDTQTSLARCRYTTLEEIFTLQNRSDSDVF